MAELSIDELRRLARNFLIGKGGEAELEDAKRAMESDPQLAMEFLQQMQTALDDVAPSGFSPQQWIEIDSRVRTLVAPLAKSGFGLGFISRFFSRLFKKSAPPEGPARIKKKGGPPEKRSKAAGASPTSLLTSEAVVAPASSSPDEGMEEMAPIAAAEAPAPQPTAEPEPEAQEAPEAASPGRGKEAVKKIFAALLGLALLAGLGWGGFKAWQGWQARKKAALIPPPAPVPTPSPTPYDGPPRRSRPPAWQEEPLPSDLPYLTPQPAGQIGRVDGLEAKDQESGKSLPLR